MRWLQYQANNQVFPCLGGPAFAALSFASRLLMGKKNGTVICGAILCPGHGIVVGAVDRNKFYKRFADRWKAGLMWQKITIFEQCENTAYFDCNAIDERGKMVGD